MVDLVLHDCIYCRYDVCLFHLCFSLFFLIAYYLYYLHTLKFVYDDVTVLVASLFVCVSPRG